MVLMEAYRTYDWTLDDNGWILRIHFAMYFVLTEIQKYVTEAPIIPEQDTQQHDKPTPQEKKEKCKYCLWPVDYDNHFNISIFLLMCDYGSHGIF